MSCNLRKNIFEHYDMKIYLSYIVTVKIIIAKSRKMRRCPTAAVPSFHTPLNFMHQKCLHALRSVEFSYLNCLTACSVRISSTFFIFLFALNRSLTFLYRNYSILRQTFPSFILRTLYEDSSTCFDEIFSGPLLTT